MKFPEAANLNSFAVLNMTLRRSANDNDYFATEFMQRFQRIAKSHGIKFPNVNSKDARVLNDVTTSTTGDSIEKIEIGFVNAVRKAKDFFVYDRSNSYRRNHVWFRTRVKSQVLLHKHPAVKRQEQFVECLVMLPNNAAAPPSRSIGLLLPEDVAFTTHVVTLPNDKVANARLKVKVRESNDLIDPFAFRYDFDKNCHEVNFSSTGREDWRSVTFERRFYVLEDKTALPEESTPNACAVYLLDEMEVDTHLEAVSLVFVILPSETAEVYGTTKMISHLVAGIPSQCIIASKYQSQRNDKSKDSYCSNLSIKVNAKLSSSSDKAHAWQISHDGVKGIPWIRDVPTFVMGIAISTTQGQYGVSIISASACLDSSCMRMAQNIEIQSNKEDIINGSILEDLTKTLLIQYYLSGNKIPQRMIIYRDGVSDGSFSRVQSQEIQSIRNAFLKFKEEIKGPSGDSVANIHNCVPITFVVCQTRNNIKIVPDNGEPGENVYSGTVVDRMIVDFNTLEVTQGESRGDFSDQLIYTEPNGDGFDFVMVAHGGGKGTSKTVHYRIILNENACWYDSSSSPLTKERLQLLTYHMSYQYSTSAKAIRIVPVVHYSSRLSNIYSKYHKYINPHKKNGDVRRLVNEDGDGKITRIDKQSLDLPSHLKSILLPNFAAFAAASVSQDRSVQYDMSYYQLPFSSHISA